MSEKGSWPEGFFPHLTNGNFKITSPIDSNYNCFAWAIEEKSIKYAPFPFDLYSWPNHINREDKLDSFFKFYSDYGYKLCKNGRKEKGFQKIALYTKEIDGELTATHVARQLPNGKWTSKIAGYEDIEHRTVHNLAGCHLGETIYYLKRKI